MKIYPRGPVVFTGCRLDGFRGLARTALQVKTREFLVAKAEGQNGLEAMLGKVRLLWGKMVLGLPLAKVRWRCRFYHP